MKPRTEDQFLANIDREVLANKPLNDLVNLYIRIEGSAFNLRLQQCKILREIRLQFGSNDLEFGKFLAQTPLSEIDTKMRTRMIQVADFFEGKDITGIMWTSAVYITEAKNRPFAQEIYTKIVGKNIAPVDVLRMCDQKRLEAEAQKPKVRPNIDAEDAVFVEMPISKNKVIPIQQISMPKMPEVKQVVDQNGEVFIEESDADKRMDVREQAIQTLLQSIKHFELVDRLYILREALRMSQPNTGLPFAKR
jgi:hypothetical protein